jgi:hypothetical protein
MTEPSAVAYERSDAEPRLLGALAAGIAAFLILTPWILLLIYPSTAHRDRVVSRLIDVPSPRLQLDPAQELAALRADEGARLSSYGWVDRAGGSVRVPIERALSLTVERGLPGWRKP